MGGVEEVCGGEFGACDAFDVAFFADDVDGCYDGGMGAVLAGLASLCAFSYTGDKEMEVWGRKLQFEQGKVVETLV